MCAHSGSTVCNLWTMACQALLFMGFSSKNTAAGCYFLLQGILSPCLFNFYAEYIMRHSGLEEAQAGIKVAGRINNLRYADDTTLITESEEELKTLLMKVKQKELKSWPKSQHSENENHGIRSHHFMGNRWGNSVRLYYFGAPKSLQMVTAAMKLKYSCSLEDWL